MRYWEELDENNDVVRTIAMNKKTIVEEFQWIHKNLGGTWRLGQSYSWDEETDNWVEVPAAEQE